MLIRASIFVISMLAHPAFAGDGFEANKQPLDTSMRFWGLSITSKEDPLIIKHIDVNRGCRQDLAVSLPITIPFGNQAFIGNFPCEPIEVEIQTPLGNRTVSWLKATNEDLIIRKYNLPSAPVADNFAGFPPTDNWSLFITDAGSPVTITAVKVNKGNCSYVGRVPMPENPTGKTLRFGDRYVLNTLSCNPIAVTIETEEDGPIDFNWDN